MNTDSSALDTTTWVRPGIAPPPVLVNPPNLDLPASPSLPPPNQRKLALPKHANMTAGQPLVQSAGPSRANYLTQGVPPSSVRTQLDFQQEAVQLPTANNSSGPRAALTVHDARTNAPAHNPTFRGLTSTEGDTAPFSNYGAKNLPAVQNVVPLSHVYATYLTSPHSLPQPSVPARPHLTTADTNSLELSSIWDPTSNFTCDVSHNSNFNPADALRSFPIPQPVSTSTRVGAPQASDGGRVTHTRGLPQHGNIGLFDMPVPRRETWDTSVKAAAGVRVLGLRSEEDPWGGSFRRGATAEPPADVPVPGGPDLVPNQAPGMQAQERVMLSTRTGPGAEPLESNIFSGSYCLGRPSAGMSIRKPTSWEGPVAEEPGLLMLSKGSALNTPPGIQTGLSAVKPPAGLEMWGAGEKIGAQSAAGDAMLGSPLQPQGGEARIGDVNPLTGKELWGGARGILDQKVTRDAAWKPVPELTVGVVKPGTGGALSGCESSKVAGSMLWHTARDRLRDTDPDDLGRSEMGLKDPRCPLSCVVARVEACEGPTQTPAGQGKEWGGASHRWQAKEGSLQEGLVESAFESGVYDVSASQPGREYNGRSVNPISASRASDSSRCLPMWGTVRDPLDRSPLHFRDQVAELQEFQSQTERLRQQIDAIRV